MGKLGLVLLVVFLSGGCLGGSYGSFKTQQISTPDTKQAYRTAMQSMAAYGQTIDTHDEASGLVMGAWSVDTMTGTEFRIRIAVGNWTTVRVDCRVKTGGSYKGCGGGDAAPHDVANAASAISRDLGGN